MQSQRQSQGQSQGQSQIQRQNQGQSQRQSQGQSQRQSQLEKKSQLSPLHEKQNKPKPETEDRPTRLPMHKPSPSKHSYISTKKKNSNKEFTIEEEAFQAFIVELITLENEIEKFKCDLALMSDFNLQDAYRIFESNKKGYLSDLDLKYGLNFLEVYPEMEVLKLVIKRYTSRRGQLHLK